MQRVTIPPRQRKWPGSCQRCLQPQHYQALEQAHRPAKQSYQCRPWRRESESMYPWPPVVFKSQSLKEIRLLLETSHQIASTAGTRRLMSSRHNRCRAGGYPSSWPEKNPNPCLRQPSHAERQQHASERPGWSESGPVMHVGRSFTCMKATPHMQTGRCFCLTSSASTTNPDHATQAGLKAELSDRYNKWRRNREESPSLEKGPSLHFPRYVTYRIPVWPCRRASMSSFCSVVAHMNMVPRYVSCGLSKLSPRQLTSGFW